MTILIAILLGGFGLVLLYHGKGYWAWVAPLGLGLVAVAVGAAAISPALATAAALFVVLALVFGLPARPELRHSEEVALHIWVPLETLRDARSEGPVHVHGQTLVRPGYQVGPHFIWGLTEKILTPFLALVLE